VRAEHLLSLMQRQHAKGNSFVIPNTRSYTSVINACAFAFHPSDRKDAFEIAFRVYKQMSLKDLRPDAVTYTSLLYVYRNCLSTTDKENRFFLSQY
jgi:hypothetical protein